MTLLHWRNGGTAVVLHLDENQLPTLVHWGPDLGELDTTALDALRAAVTRPYFDSVVASPAAVSVLPLHSAGWIGRPGLLGSREGRDWSPRFSDVRHDSVSAETEGGTRLRSTADDEVAGLRVSTEIELTVEGLLRVAARVENRGNEDYQLDRLELAVPVPEEAVEVVDMTGRHNHERQPQRRPFDVGHWTREAWGGKPGHDSPLMICAGSEGFGFRSGRVWGVHVAHSGDQVLGAERSFTGWRLLRGGELFWPGEMRLAPGDAYTSPVLVASWGEGLDEMSQRIHEWLRRRPQHPRSPRPVVLNTWEAVGFDHDHDTLLALADRAASVGVERFVLDDGWFTGRRDDTAGLGDWTVDREIWPNGLHPLVDRVRGLGMDFGLWIEPEMVNLDSDLARAHPDWLLQTTHGPGVASRQQHVLDLTQPEVYFHVLREISAVLAEYSVDFVKWDHNRPLVDAGIAPDGRPGVHAQTTAAYRLMDELRSRHPGIEIESCSAGGARLDLGVLEHVDRVWVSDCIDAHERHRMVRWTSLTHPLELLGTHVGDTPDHSTGRVHSLDFRAGTALWGNFGIEWDLTSVADEDLKRLAQWVRLYKEIRHLLSTGTVVRTDLPDTVWQLDGVVAPDRAEAIYRLSCLGHPVTWPPGRVRLQGLDPDRSYRVAAQSPGDAAVNGEGVTAPVAWTGDGVVLTGRLLAEVGIQAPVLDVDSLVLIRVYEVT